MDDRRFILNGRALLAFNSLTRSEREALTAAIGSLVDRSQGEWGFAGAVRLESAEPLYFLRVDKSLRAIVRPSPDGRPEILDLVRHETLERFFQGVG